jgi:hypothetical protein
MNPRPILLVLCLAGNVLLATAVWRHGSNAPRSEVTVSVKNSAPKMERRRGNRPPPIW